jgi:predicted  nucleic acid-binding Zn-ribbon protein
VAIVDLTLRRLDKLEKAQRATNTQIAELRTQMQDSLGRVVEVLEAHSRHFERMEEALIGISEGVDGLSGRMDRLVSAIARGRTQDLARLDDYQRRLHTVETRLRRPRGRK